MNQLLEAIALEAMYQLDPRHMDRQTWFLGEFTKMKIVMIPEEPQDLTMVTRYQGYLPRPAFDMKAMLEETELAELWDAHFKGKFDE